MVIVNQHHAIANTYSPGGRETKHIERTKPDPIVMVGPTGPADIEEAYPGIRPVWIEPYRWGLLS
jgi:hypothetical protein